jgi:hypothetical protein
MTAPLFSRYAQGENRVTSTIMAVLSRINFTLVERIIQLLIGDEALQLVRFENQPKGKGSVPDARLHAAFSLWIETKTARNAVREDQLLSHLKLLNGGPDRRLLVLTPDSIVPSTVAKLQEDEPRLFWANFASLVETVASELQDTTSLPTDREVFLLHELVSFLETEGLVRADDDEVLLVPASRYARDEYDRYSAYICQPNRSFRQVGRMAFYHAGRILRHIPAVKGMVESVSLSEAGLGELRAESLPPDVIQPASDLLSALLRDNNFRVGTEDRVKLVLLSEHDDPETFVLPHEIENDKRGAGGQLVAFTQGQRYVSFAKLQKAPRRTSELENHS